MKALNEYFLLVVFMLLLNRVHLLVLTKPKGVTTQMKALDENFLMVVFMSLLNVVHVFTNFMLNLNRETWQ